MPDMSFFEEHIAVWQNYNRCCNNYDKSFNTLCSLSHRNFFLHEIYKQMEFFTVKDNYTKNSVAEVKTDKSDNIDNSLDINDLKGE